MDSQEGLGIAYRAWRKYVDLVGKGTKKVPATYWDRVLRPYGIRTATDMMGFWLAWHLHGGFEGLLQMGMPRRTIYRHISRFREVTGVHPDEFTLDGVTIDVEAYLKGSGKKISNR